MHGNTGRCQKELAYSQLCLEWRQNTVLEGTTGSRCWEQISQLVSILRTVSAVMDWNRGDTVYVKRACVREEQFEQLVIGGDNYSTYYQS